MEKPIILENKCLELLQNFHQKQPARKDTVEQTIAILIGRYVDNRFHILSCADCASLMEDDIKGTIQHIRQMVTGGICGIAYPVNPDKPIPSITIKSEKRFEIILREVDTQDAVILQMTDQEGPRSPACTAYLYTADGTLTEQGNVTVADSDTLHSLVIARAVCQLPLSFEYQGDWQMALHSAIEQLAEDIVSDSTLFRLGPGQILLGTGNCYGVPDTEVVEYLTRCANSEDDGQTSPRGKHRKSMRCLNFDVYTDLSCDCSLERQPSCAPIVHYSQESNRKVTMTLPVDVLAVVDPHDPVSSIAEVLCTAISRQLFAMEECIYTHSQEEKFQVPVPYHYRPLQLQTFYTVLHPQGIPDADLESHRREIHERLCMPLDRPLFRRANRVSFAEEGDDRGYLVNVHEGLTGSKVKDGTEFTVQGSYTYHHYMQDRFDDNRWGCAYRSLQTLASWFRLQGYTEHDIPSHRAIQQALVDVGDKEGKFVESKTWIGSLEVSFVLDHLFGVTSKILSVNSGVELSSKGRELSTHFTTQGTPIMIGGGVLAHTILGVDYNDVTGDINFLILDPHYTGAEDVKTILDKGWCGWKGPEFWDQHAHYNLCMPQRPKVI